MTQTKEKAETKMSPQQQRFSEREAGAFETYRNLVVGDRGIPDLLAYELYNFFLAGLSGVLGYGLRSYLLPTILGSGIKPVVGTNVLIRQPSRVFLGKGVLLDDNVVLDVRDGRDAARGELAPLIDLADTVFVGRNSSIIAKGARIRLGAACNVSTHCRIASESFIEIGESTLIAAYSYIGPGNHLRDESGRVQIEAEMPEGTGVKIGSGCWIGTRATILDGVTIGDNVVVGAHSLVREDVPDGAVVAGTPARIIEQ